jgi:hypothetical protein
MFYFVAWCLTNFFSSGIGWRISLKKWGKLLEECGIYI